jgi:hypothetical protein
MRRQPVSHRLPQRRRSHYTLRHLFHALHLYNDHSSLKYFFMRIKITAAAAAAAAAAPLRRPPHPQQ